jgi:hypothetical protein
MTMDVPRAMNGAVPRLPPHKARPACSWCGRGKLDLIDERPDPIFGVLGMRLSTLKCVAPECGKLTII